MAPTRKNADEQLSASLPHLRLRLLWKRMWLITASTSASATAAATAARGAAPASTSAVRPTATSRRSGTTPVQLRLVPKGPRRTAAVLGNAHCDNVSIYIASIHLTHRISSVIDVVILHESKSFRLTSIKIQGHVNVLDAPKLVKLSSQCVGVGSVVQILQHDALANHTFTITLVASAPFAVSTSPSTPGAAAAAAPTSAVSAAHFCLLILV